MTKNSCRLISLLVFLAAFVSAAQAKPDLIISRVEITKDTSNLFVAKIIVTVTNQCRRTSANASYVLLTFKENEQPQAKARTENYKQYKLRSRAMKKLTKSILSAIVIVGGLTFTGCSSAVSTGSSAPGGSEKTQTAGGAMIKDPDGYYKYFSDASITKPPQKDAVFGNGQTITVEYDGSKSKEGDSLFYQLSYVNKDGSVLPVTGGAFTGTTKGTFTTDSKVYTSDADGRPGFMEVSIVQNAKVVGGEQGITGKNVKLGMYPIKFEVSK